MVNFPLIDPCGSVTTANEFVGVPLIVELILFSRAVGEVLPTASKFPLSETDEPIFPEDGVMLVIVGAGKLSFR